MQSGGLTIATLPRLHGGVGRRLAIGSVEALALSFDSDATVVGQVPLLRGQLVVALVDLGLDTVGGVWG